MQHLHMRQYVARSGQECKSELIVGAGFVYDKLKKAILDQFIQ